MDPCNPAGASSCPAQQSDWPSRARPTSRRRRRKSKDDRLREEAAIREEALLELYAAALAAFPDLATELEPLRRQHQEHRVALGARELPEGQAIAAGSLLGGTRQQARVRVAALERATADGHAAAVLPAGRALAQVLASLSACEAAHAEALR